MRLFILLLLAINACAVAAAPPRVVVSLKPIHSLAASVMEGVGKPELLLSANRSPHNFVLKPSDMRRLTDADLVIWVGRELELPLLKVLKAAGNETNVLELMRQPEIAKLLTGRAAQGHEHHHHEGETEQRADPHIWLSPDVAGLLVTIMAEQLSRIDSANQGRYLENANQTRQRLQRLDRNLKELLRPLAQQPYLVFHDGYGWFEEHYGLSSLGAVTINPQRQPGAAGLRALRKRLQQGGAKCIFTEPQFSPKMAQRLAQDGGLRIGLLDPLGTEIEPGKDAYFSLMMNLARSLKHCLLQ